MPAPVLGVARSLSGRRWVWRTAEERVGLGLAQRLGVSEIVGRLLAARGVTADDAADFLAPTLRALLPDPSVLADMDAAAERLAGAVRRAETVGIFGDYDVDGACSTALLASALRALGCAVLTHVPDRVREGYGPNAPALRGLVARGASLIVCVDCGSAAGEVLACLVGGADALVLDHHPCGGAVASAAATVNPNRLDCRAGLGTLCAAGVTFLALIATVRALRRAGWFGADRPEPDLLGLLDLVALATVCDVMPLVGLNRAIVTQGLRVMARARRPGIAALLDVAEVRRAPDVMSLGYALGPRINAAGRIDEADLGMRLLLTQDEVEARAIAERLNRLNQQRQVVEADMLEAAMSEAEAQRAAGHPVLLVADARFHPGVVGIVAGRIRERFNRPACVAAIAEGVAKGSGRSVPGHDLGRAVAAARAAGLASAGGGHALAAGFTADEAALPALHTHLCEQLATAATLPDAADLRIEATLGGATCSAALAGEIARLGPFGAGNEEPVLALPHLRVTRADRVGRDGATVRALLQSETGGALIKALLFRGKDGALAEALLAGRGMALHVAGHLRMDMWQGQTSQSFVLADAAPG